VGARSGPPPREERLKSALTDQWGGWGKELADDAKKWGGEQTARLREKGGKRKSGYQVDAYGGGESGMVPSGLQRKKRRTCVGLDSPFGHKKEKGRGQENRAARHEEGSEGIGQSQEISG